MNKIININLAGRLIPINEDAYQILDRYLVGLKMYFSKEEGGAEILHDMEDRIGELFQEKLKKGSGSITKEDVNGVIAIMGSPQQIIEETGADEKGNFQEKQNENIASSEPEPAKRLKRSEREKVIGGVCGGIASYFNIDPVIVRIIFAFVALAWGSGVIIYLILWALLPEADAEPIKLRRRLYRNTDQKVIGGVCSGIGAYLNVDPIWPRLIFVLPILGSIFFGIANVEFLLPISIGGMPSMVLLYIVLWASLPKANTITEKLEMKGKKVDVKNISDAVKQQETAVPIKKNDSHFLIVLIKIFVFFVGGVILLTILSVLVALIFSFFYTSSSYSMVHFQNMIFDNENQKIIFFLSISLLILIPIYALIRLLAYLISGKKIKNPKWLSFTLVILFIGSIFSLFWFAGEVATDFKMRYYKKETVQLQPILNDTILISNKSMLSSENEGVENVWQDGDFNDRDFFFRLNDNKDLFIQTVNLNIIKSTDSLFHLEIEKSAYGKNMEKAKALAIPLSFNFKQNGNQIYFPNEIQIPNNQPFRGQSITATIQVPVGKAFYLNGLSANSRSKRSFSFKRGNISINNVSSSDYDNDTYYKMTASGDPEELE